MSIFRGAEDSCNMASVMCIEADVLLVSGNTNKALATINKALTIFKDKGDARGEYVALCMKEHITGPQEDEPPEVQPQASPQQPQQPQWTQEDWDKYQIEQWNKQQEEAKGPEE